MTSFSHFMTPTKEKTQIESKREIMVRPIVWTCFILTYFLADVFDGHQSDAFHIADESTGVGSGSLSIFGNRDSSTESRVLSAHDRILADVCVDPTD